MGGAQVGDQAPHFIGTAPWASLSATLLVCAYQDLHVLKSAQAAARRTLADVFCSNCKDGKY
jgi:F0F1-type ATP synthase assembly protein I